MADPVGGLLLPAHPRAVAAAVRGLHRGALLDGVGGLPEAAVTVGEYPLLLREPGEHVLDEGALLRQVLEDLRPEHEVAAVLPHRHLLERGDRRDRALVADVDEVERRLRRYRQHPADLVGRGGEPLDHRVQRRVGEQVGVVGEEHLLALEEVSHPTEALTDRRVRAGVDERDRPVLHVAAEQLHPTVAEHEVGGRRLVVVQEEVLDVMSAMPEAQDEVVVSEVGVVAHDVPQQRPRTHWMHGFGQVVALGQPPTEQHDLHPHRLLSPRRHSIVAPTGSGSISRGRRCMGGLAQNEMVPCPILSGRIPMSLGSTAEASAAPTGGVPRWSTSSTSAASPTARGRGR